MNIKQINKIIASTVVATAAVFGGWSSSAKATSLISGRIPETAVRVKPSLVLADNPDDAIVQPGTGFDGVVALVTTRNEGRFLCSGALLNSGRDILTAAHCLTDDFGALNAKTSAVFFDLPTGRVIVNTDQFFIHPDWKGVSEDLIYGGDLAIVKLPSEAPLTAERYDIYRTQDEIGKVSVKVGYGGSGTGNEGEVLRFGVKRSGENIYDASGEVLNSLFGSVDGVLLNALLAYDFDNGLPENDAFGYYLGIKDLGLGEKEAIVGSGDSGGPTLINGLIAGITSYSTCVTKDNLNCDSPPDIDNFLNSSFGEFGVDTRVSAYASWIDSITGVEKVPELSKVPEPGMVGALFLTGAATLLSRKNSSKRVKKG